MTDEMIALARRAVACKGWRWMPGMKYIHRHDIGPDVWYPRIGRHGEKPVRAKTRKDMLPMFDDPATLGCLLALVREAWIAPTVYARPTKTTWIVMMGSGKGFGKVCEASTEAEALVNALENAP